MPKWTINPHSQPTLSLKPHHLSILKLIFKSHSTPSHPQIATICGLTFSKQSWLSVLYSRSRTQGICCTSLQPSRMALMGCPSSGQEASSPVSRWRAYRMAIARFTLATYSLEFAWSCFCNSRLSSSALFVRHFSLISPLMLSSSWMKFSVVSSVSLTALPIVLSIQTG